MLTFNLWLARYEGLPLNAFEEHQTILYFLFLLFLIFLAFIRAFENTYLKELFRAVLDINFIEHLKREGKLKYRLANLALDLIYLGTIALLLFNLQFAQVLTIWEAFLWVLGYFVMKVTLSALIGSIFYGNEGVKLLIIHLMLFYRIAGITLLPFVFISSFLEFPYQQWSLSLIGSLLLFCLLIRIGRALIQVKVKLDYGLFYNFLYICAVELSPLIIVLKMITQNLLN